MDIKEDRAIIRATLKIPYNLTPEERDRIIESILHLKSQDKKGALIPFHTEHRTIYVALHKQEKEYIDFSINPGDKDQFIEVLSPQIKKIERLMADAAYQKELLGYLDAGSYVRAIDRLPRYQRDELLRSVRIFEEVMADLAKAGKLFEALNHAIELFHIAKDDLDKIRPQTMAEVIAARSKPDYKKISESVLDVLGIRQV